MGAVECRHAEDTSVASGKMFPFCCLFSPTHALAHCGLFIYKADRDLMEQGKRSTRGDEVLRRTAEQEQEPTQQNKT